MQLTRALACALLAAVPGIASAGGNVEAASTVFHESGGPLHMTVVNPSVTADVALADALSLQAGWEADVVTGASVAVVDAPGDVDAITSATRVEDVRHVAHAGLRLGDPDAAIEARYAYGFERDYRSHALSLRASTELFDHNTTLSVGYARGWDALCDLLQPEAERAVQRQRLPSGDGCFAKDRGRTDHAIALHTLDGAWTQAWTPIFNTQWSVSTQLVSGFQSNPYRAVWLGRAAAQEHHPRERARYATTLAARLWIRPLGGALALSAQLYRDSWDVRAMAYELGFERALGAHLRLRLRGRYYRQSGAAFFSDDYGLAPKGAYFTGDRELSPLDDWLFGVRLEAAPFAGSAGRWPRLREGLRCIGKLDGLMHVFRAFHYGEEAVPNRRAVIATLALDLRY
ncbi:MAG: DUF3570 domain-containing protein [Polyangiales bacterium]